MAETLEDMKAQLQALRARRYSGVRRTRTEDLAVDYATDSEMAAAIADLEARIDAAEAGRGRIRRAFAVKDL